MRMETRLHVRLSTLHRKVNTSALDDDWVTIGVIVSKSETRMSAKVAFIVIIDAGWAAGFVIVCSVTVNIIVILEAIACWVDL